MLLSKENKALEMGLSAAWEGDEEGVLRVLDYFRELGIELIRNTSGPESKNVISNIKTIGEAATRQRIAIGTLDAFIALGRIGKEAARKNLDEETLNAALALEFLGKSAAKQQLKFPIRIAAQALKEIGKEAARQDMEKTAIASQLLLKKVGSCEGLENEEELSCCILASIREIGKAAANAGLEDAVLSAEILLEEAQLTLHRELHNRKKPEENERKMYETTCKALHCLEEIGKISARQNLHQATVHAMIALENIRADAEIRYLGGAVLTAEAMLDSFIEVPLLEKTRERDEIRRLHEEVYAHIGQYM